MVAAEGPRLFADRGADALVYWSEVREESTDPDSPADFGFPGPSDPLPPRGLTFGAHDPAGGGLFDFSRCDATEQRSEKFDGKIEEEDGGS